MKISNNEKEFTLELVIPTCEYNVPYKSHSCKTDIHSEMCNSANMIIPWTWVKAMSVECLLMFWNKTYSEPEYYFLTWNSASKATKS